MCYIKFDVGGGSFWIRVLDPYSAVVLEPFPLATVTIAGICGLGITDTTDNIS